MEQFREQAFFIIVFGATLLAAFFFQLPTSPFRLSSLLAVFLFLLVSRSLVDSKFFPLSGYSHSRITFIQFFITLQPFNIFCHGGCFQPCYREML
jgi:hypothetical protein